MTHHIFLLLFFPSFFFWQNALWNFGLVFFWKMHVWMNECMNFFRRCTYEYMIFFNAYIVHVWKIYFWQKKCFYECMIFWLHIWCMFEWFFSCEKMYLWNFEFFSFENAFMNAWFFWNAYIMYVWMILFYFMRKYIDEI